MSRAVLARGVEEVALALGIDSILDRPTQELSGGEQQRVALGAALVGRPRMVLLDEPTSQLDPVAGDELIGLLRRLNQEWETTVLLCEHRLERCLAAADRVIAVYARGVARAALRPLDPPWRGPRRVAGRDGRAHGSQRRGQVDAPAPRCGPARADARAHRARRTGRVASAEPWRLPHPRAR